MVLTESMREALRLAQDSVEAGGGPFGAVIVRGDEIVAGGCNQVVEARDPTAHAEVLAIRNAARKLGTHDLSGCRIYTSCEPCPMCLGAIYWARLESVTYGALRSDASEVGFDDELIYDEIQLPLEERRLKFEQEGHAEALKVLRAWKAKADRMEY